jgi:hypothetical protein
MNATANFWKEEKRISVENGYQIKGELKQLGFQFDDISTNWNKKVSSLDEAIDTLVAIRELRVVLPDFLEKFIGAYLDESRPEANRQTIKNVVLKGKLGF